MALTQVKTAGIAADAVTGAKIADDQINSEHYVDGSIDNAHVADDQINSEHYADASIDHAHLANDCVDSDNIADNSVGLAALAGIGRGALITGDASGDPKHLAAGSNDQVLTMDANGDFGWEAPAAGGATINNATANELVTVASTTTQLDAESSLTFDGSTLKVFGTEGNNANVQLIADDGDDNADYWLTQATTDGKYRVLNYADGGWESNIVCTGSAGVKLYFNNSEKMEANNTGISVTGSVTPSSGLYIGGTGGSNHLDDYEEGTWTFTLNNGSNYSYQVGRYIKVGNLCFINGSIKVTSEPSSGSFAINTLPFSSANVSYLYHTASLHTNNFQNQANAVQAWLPQNATYYTVHELDASGNNAVANSNAVGDPGEIVITGCYETA